MYIFYSSISKYEAASSRCRKTERNHREYESQWAYRQSVERWLRVVADTSQVPGEAPRGITSSHLRMASERKWSPTTHSSHQPSNPRFWTLTVYLLLTCARPTYRHSCTHSEMQHLHSSSEAGRQQTLKHGLKPKKTWQGETSNLKTKGDIGYEEELRITSLAE